MKNESEKVVEEKVTWRGWISLFTLIILFCMFSIAYALFVMI